MKGSPEVLIDQTYFVTGVGTVVGGTVMSGVVSVNQNMLLGPDGNGLFIPVQVNLLSLLYPFFTLIFIDFVVFSTIRLSHILILILILIHILILILILSYFVCIIDKECPH
jgi:hypothetical protein